MFMHFNTLRRWYKLHSLSCISAAIIKYVKLSIQLAYEFLEGFPIFHIKKYIIQSVEPDTKIPCIFYLAILIKFTMHSYSFKYCLCRSSSLYLDNCQCYTFSHIVCEGGVTSKIWNKLDLCASFRSLHTKFGVPRSYHLWDPFVHTDRQTDMTISTQLVVLIKNIYTS